MKKGEKEGPRHNEDSALKGVKIREGFFLFSCISASRASREEDSGREARQEGRVLIIEQGEGKKGK